MRIITATITALLLSFSVWSSVALADIKTNSSASAPSPNIELTPDQVVVIVVDALKHNDPTKDDDGIATVFEFASPGNRAMTGPLERFTQMIKRGFSDMLNHFDSSYGEMEISNNKALQSVWLTSRAGVETGYVFQLGRQIGGEYDGMWMTESVWPIGNRNPKGQSI